jgi:creatinine amidohydrolase
MKNIFMKVQLFMVVLLVLCTCFLESAGKKDPGGYSIFHETMADMTWPEVEKAAKQGAVILLPTGVIEEHGPHMGTGVDTYCAYLTCKLTRRVLEARGIKTLIAPPFYWGINKTTHVFPGTFTVRIETMKALLHDILASLKSWGFTTVFNINWHGDGYHCMTILESMRDARKSLNMKTYCVLSQEEIGRFRLTGKEEIVVSFKAPQLKEDSQKYVNLHAGFMETGIMAAFFPLQVDMALARSLKQTKLTYNDLMDWLKDAKRVTPLGYFGNPAGFKIKESKKFMYDYSQVIANSIEHTLKKEK